MTCAYPDRMHHEHVIQVNHGTGTVGVCTDHLGAPDLWDKVPEVLG